ncbi:MAG: cysteine methyltransferase, partial [Actinomycetota bacterium]
MSGLELLVGEVATPLGALTLVASPRGVVATAFDDDDPDATVAGIEAKLDARARSAQRRLSTVRREVEDYFEGRIRTFA